MESYNIINRIKKGDDIPKEKLMDIFVTFS